MMATGIPEKWSLQLLLHAYASSCYLTYSTNYCLIVCHSLLSDICVLEVEEKLQPAKEEVVTLIQETLANKLQKNSPIEEITLSL